ncbi:MAG: hypothetical protein HZC25_08885 [Rhodospirillales bacterium]|nr:hypothetical protein [Rhodospirillales bacterium]
MERPFLSARRRYANYFLVAKWIGTASGVAGALIIALNLGVVAYGFMLFLVSSVLWAIVGWVQREAALVVLQGAFTLINVLGIVRWFGN